MVTKFLDVFMFLVVAAIVVNLIMHPQAASSIGSTATNFLVTQERTFAGYGYN